MFDKNSLDNYITGHYGEDQLKGELPPYIASVAVPSGKHKELAKSWTIRVSRADNLPISEKEINEVCQMIVEMVRP